MLNALLALRFMRFVSDVKTNKVRNLS